MDSRNWTWVEKFLHITAIPTLVQSIAISILLFSIFVYFSFRVPMFKLSSDAHYAIEVIPMCILVGYELFGIEYMLRNSRKIFKNILIKQNLNENITHNSLYCLYKYRLTRSHWYYAIVALVILPLLSIDIIAFKNEDLSLFYTWQGTTSSFFLDIYNYVVTYLIDFLLAIIVWIIINMSLILHEMGNEEYIYPVNIDFLSSDKLGGLFALKSLILKIVVFYFICIALAIASYISPFSLISYQGFFYIVLLLIGVFFFIVCLVSIRKSLEGKIKKETSVLSDLYTKKHDRIVKILSEDGRDNKEELSQLSIDIDLINKCHEKLIQIDWKIFDFKAIAAFITSFLIPNLALIQKIPQLSEFAANLGSHIPIIFNVI